MNFEFSIRRRGNQPMGLGGRLFVSVVCIIFFAGGVFMAYLLGRQIIESLRTRGWQSTACTIVRRSIAETPPYTAKLDYTYQFNGKSYKSDAISTGYRGSGDYYDAQKILDAFPAGPGSVSRVNPADPTEAVLQTPSLWIVFEILFPLVFIAVGGGLFYLIWWPPKMTANPSNPTKSRKVAMIVCGGFFVTGVAMLCIVASMYQRYRSVQNWVAVPCTIVRSSVASHTSSSDRGDSTTYSVEVLFRYTFDQKQHASSRYSLTSSSSSGYDDKKKIVDALNSNRRQECYVNPLDPDDAVLDRHDEFLVIILAVMGSIFFAAGAGGLGATARSVRKQHRSRLDIMQHDQAQAGQHRPDAHRRP